jgi:hypothetical protein
VGASRFSIPTIQLQLREAARGVGGLPNVKEHVAARRFSHITRETAIGGEPLV